MDPSNNNLNNKEILEVSPTLVSKDDINVDSSSDYNALVQYKRFWFTPMLVDTLKVIQETFEARPKDIILATSPKSGTTWLKALAFAIMTKHQYNEHSTSPLLTTLSHSCVPFIELSGFSNMFNCPEYRGGGRLLSTHLPYTLLPKSIITSASCKLVYLCRNPKDILVSFWHFNQAISGPTPLEEYFTLFCEGKHRFGPCWEHILSYWKASLDWPEKVLFLKYEDLKKDTVGCVKRLAEFIGCPFSPEEEDAGRIAKIIELCSFENLRNLEVSKAGTYCTPFVKVDNKRFYRKGNVGDWKKHLTPEMEDKMDRITEEKFKGYEITF